jgi:hypothetical protein
MQKWSSWPQGSKDQVLHADRSPMWPMWINPHQLRRARPCAPTLATTSKTSRCVACGPKTRAKRKLYLGRLGQVWPVPMENRKTVICSRYGLQIPNYLLEVPQMQIISRLKFRLLVDEPHSYFAHTVASTKKCEIRFKVGDGTWQVTPPPDCWLYRFLVAMARCRKLAMTLIVEYWVHTMNKCWYIYILRVMS